MPVDWKAPDSFNRLLAATVASMDGQMKLNYKRIADFYGDGATYDAIEGRFRIIKKQAAKLRDEVDSGRPVAPARGSSKESTTPRKPRTPKKQGAQDCGVLTGRITKSNNSTPTKKRPEATEYIKTEPLEPSTSNSTTSSLYSDLDTPASSIDHSSSGLDDSYYGSTLASFNMGLDGNMDAATDPHLEMLIQENFWDQEHLV